MLTLVSALLAIGFALLIYVLRQLYLNERRERMTARLNAAIANVPIYESPIAAAEMSAEEIAGFNRARWD